MSHADFEHTHTHTHTEREREREREKSVWKQDQNKKRSRQHRRQGTYPEKETEKGGVGRSCWGKGAGSGSRTWAISRPIEEDIKDIATVHVFRQRIGAREHYICKLLFTFSLMDVTRVDTAG
jgi:hypothetical protein